MKPTVETDSQSTPNRLSSPYFCVLLSCHSCLRVNNIRDCAVTHNQQGAAVVGQNLPFVRRKNAAEGTTGVVGREPFDGVPVRKHAAADSGFAAAGRIDAAARRNQPGRRRGVGGGASEKSLRNGENHGLLVLAKALPGASGSWALEGMQKRIAAAAIGGIPSSPGKQNGKSGLMRKISPCCLAQSSTGSYQLFHSDDFGGTRILGGGLPINAAG